MDGDARSPETPEPEQVDEQQAERAASGSTPPPEAANEVLQDEIESIHAIGEDQ